MDQVFQVDLRGLVDLLSRNLYSSPRVYLRELLQNSVDAIHARRLDDAGLRGRIVITPADVGAGSLTIVDNGVGLTEDETATFLATIGRTSKRDLFDLPRSDYLGQFGIGLLACFMVSDTISVTTCSARGGAAVRWTGSADGTYRTELLDEPTEIGTTVELVPTAGAEHWLASGSVLELAGHYGELLPESIEVALPRGLSTSVNVAPPWSLGGDTADAREALMEHGRRVLGFEPFDVVPLAAPAAELVGAAYILPESTDATSRQQHRVYVKRMLVSASVDDLLPPWAFFARCIVDAGELRPTASREALFQDETLEAARDQLGAALRTWLIGLAEGDPAKLRAFIATHARAIKAAAVHDNELLQIMLPWLPFETTNGEMTLPEFARRFPVVRFTRGVEEFRQLAPVAATQGLGLVNGGYVYDAELIEQLPSVVPGASVEPVDSADLIQAFAEPDVSDLALSRRLMSLADEALRDRGCASIVRAFEPAALPALFATGEDARRQRITGQAREATSSSLWGDILGTFGEDPAALSQLCLNISNSLVRRIAAISDDTLAVEAIRVVYVQSLLLGHHPLRRDDLLLLNRSLAELLDRAVGR